MLDIKTLKSALLQLEDEKKIPQTKIIEAIEQALAAAYKKEYGKKGQIVRAQFDLDTGTTEFSQIKIVVDESTVRMPEPGEEELNETEEEAEFDPNDERPRFNAEHHILIEDAQKIKKDVTLGEEIIFPLESKDDFGRIAAQTAKQVIIQRIREAERGAVVSEYGAKEGEIVSGYVQKVERGTIFIDFNRAVGILPYEEQIPGEQYKRGDRIRAYMFSIEESPRSVTLRLSRAHPKFLQKLFEMEAPEIASGMVEIKNIAREPGSRSKIAVFSHDEHVDPVGSCVGQKGVRVNTITNELSGEKIDIIPWSHDVATYVTNALSPARKILDLTIDQEEHKATVNVADDQLSLAIGKGGQNVRLAAKLTGWKIDIKGVGGETLEGVYDENTTEEGFVSLKDLKKDAQSEETGDAYEEMAPVVDEEDVVSSESTESEVV